MKQTEPDWLEKVRETHKFHIVKLKENKNWTITKTASALDRSIASVSEHLKVYQWLKTHEGELMKCEYFFEAIEFVRRKKKELELEDSNL